MRFHYYTVILNIRLSTTFLSFFWRYTSLSFSFITISELFCHILILCYHIILSSSTISCFSSGDIPAGTQYFRNYRWLFTQCCNARDIQETFRIHFEGKKFLKISQSKSCFCVKNLWFDNNKCWSFGKFHKTRSNFSRIFEKHSKNVCFKNIPRISPEYCGIMKIFLEVKKFKKRFCGLSCENLKLAVFSLAMFFWTLLKPFYI